MARIQLELPEKFIFQTEVTVRIADLNYGNHVGNDAILLLMQEARVQFYRSKGFKDEINLEGTVGQIVADAAIIYKSESFLGDVLSIRIGVADITKYSFDLYYVLENKGSAREVARGKTGIVCFDYTKRKVAAVPSSLLAVLR